MLLHINSSGNTVGIQKVLSIFMVFFVGAHSNTYLNAKNCIVLQGKGIQIIIISSEGDAKRENLFAQLEKLSGLPSTVK